MMELIELALEIIGGIAVVSLAITGVVLTVKSLKDIAKQKNLKAIKILDKTLADKAGKCKNVLTYKDAFGEDEKIYKVESDEISDDIRVGEVIYIDGADSYDPLFGYDMPEVDLFDFSSEEDKEALRSIW